MGLDFMLVTPLEGAAGLKMCLRTPNPRGTSECSTTPGDVNSLEVPLGQEFDDEPEESERRDIISVKRLHVAADGSGLGEDDDDVGRSSSS